MDATFKTVVHRFGISQGVVQERPQNVLVLEGPAMPSSWRHRGQMYLLVDVIGPFPSPARVVKLLSEAVRNTYYHASGSVTGSIGAALAQAANLLFEENLNSPRESRGIAGITCAVLRGNDLYLGQIGPALAYLLQPEGLRRFPEESLWLRQGIPPQDEWSASPPLGLRRNIQPAFYHATVAQGDTFMLASPILAGVATSRAVAEALAHREGAPQLLRRLVTGEEMSAVIVSIGSPAPASDEAAAALGAGEEDDLPPGALPDASSARGQRMERPASRPLAAEDLEEVEAEEEEYPVEDQPSRPSLRDRLSRLAAQQRVAGRSSRPAPSHEPQSRFSIRTVVVLALLIPVLAVAVVSAYRWNYERTRRAQVEELLQQAISVRDTGFNSGQKDSLREGLRNGLKLIDDALAISPADASALQLHREMLEQLDAASTVQRLYTIWELADFSAGEAGSAEPTRVIVRGTDLFVLDRGSGRVYRRLLNPAGDALEPPASDAQLVQKGQAVGSIVVGDLLDMIWMPAGGEQKTSNLMILERNGSLLQWDVTRGITVLPVANSAAWRKPVAAGSYFGNFYLLDAAQNRILKYEPTAGGYTSPPKDYLPADFSGDLSTAVDMAIDGHIYVLLADGTILKFLSGKEEPFTLGGLDVPLSNPVALCVTGDDDTHGSVYVADAGLARVVQFTKEGQFVRQFKAADGQTALDKLQGLFVDENRQRVFLTSGAKLYCAPLPQPGVNSPTPTTSPVTPQS